MLSPIFSSPLESIGSIPFAQHVGTIGIITALLFGYLAVVLKMQRWRECQSTARERHQGAGMLLIIATVLVMVNAVYILFCVIQFTYLFGGEENNPLYS